MEDQYKFKVLGAFVVGFAIVGGAYTISNFGKSSFPAPATTETQGAVVAEAPLRTPIPIKDTNNDGVEDWREAFVTNTVVSLPTGSSSDYTIPNTLTDQVGINLIQDIVRAEGFSGFSRSTDEIITSTVEKISQYGQDTVIDVRNITISEDNSPEAIRIYANAAANAITGNSNPDLQYELLLLREALQNSDPKAIADLAELAEVYKQTRDDTLLLTVPSTLAKQHLDLVNVYHALYNDITGMSASLTDPMLSLVRLKRYEEDAQGLGMALQNMFLALEPYAPAFSKDDPAVLFVAFSPNFQ